MSLLKTCRVCGKIYAEKYAECPHCHGAGAQAAQSAQAKVNAIATGCIGVLVVLCLVLVLSVKGCMANQDAEREKENAIKQEQADRTEASAHGLSLSEYRDLSPVVGDAIGDCKKRVANRAIYDYSYDWSPNVYWQKTGDQIFIAGHDLRIKNAFGQYRYVDYTCIWNIKQKLLTEEHTSAD